MRHGIYGILLIVIGIATSEILWDLCTTNYDRKNSTSYSRKE